MAEALGIVGSIIGIIQLTTTVTNLCFEYMSTVKGASKDIADLVNELYALRGVFEYLNTHLRPTSQIQNPSSSNPRASTIQLLDLPNGPLKRCYKLLQELEIELTNRPRLGRHLVWPFKEKEILKYIARLERDKTLFGLAMHGDHMALSAEIERYCQTAQDDFQEFRRDQKRLIGDIQDVRSEVEDLKQEARRQKAKDEAEKREKVLNWFTTTDHHAIQADTRDRWHPGTCGWIFETNEFKDWISDDRNSQLLCTGIPGAGKTILTSAVIDHLISRFANDNVGIAFTYFNFQDRENHKAANVISNFIKQLACQKSELPSSVESLYDKCAKQGRKPTIEELKTTLGEVSKTDFTKVIYVLDALDECNEEHRRGFLNGFMSEQENAAKVFATSRHHPSDIKEPFQRASKLDIAANSSDIELFVRSKFEGTRIEPSLLEKIMLGLLTRSKGMFLLVALQTQHLLQQISPRQMERALESMSPDLDTAYKHAKERIMQQAPPRRNLALAILEWVVHATRPLKVNELQEALAVEPGDTKLDERNITTPEILVDVCAGLIAIDARSSIVHLAHFTIQTYLLKSGEGALAPSISLSRTCLTYLLFDSFNSGPCESQRLLSSRLRHHSLLGYAARNWAYHLRGPIEGNFEDLILQLLQSSPKILASLQVAHTQPEQFTWNYKKYLDYTPAAPITTAAASGLPKTVRLLLEQGADVETRDICKRTALHLAALNGHDAVVEILLENDVDVEARDRYERTALYTAASNGQETVVRLLLGNGADTEARDENGWAALRVAAFNRHDVVVKILLKNGADIEARDRYERTALYTAASNGQETVVRLLLGNGADTEARDENGWAALRVAAFNRHGVVVKILLENGADIEARDRYGRTALHMAASNEHEAAVKLLLENGADTEVQDENGRTALHSAAFHGNEAVVRPLLEKGADIDAQDKDRQTALLVATREGHKRVVKLLFENGADISVRDKGQRTAMDIAASLFSRQVSREILNILMDDIRTKGFSEQEIRGWDSARYRNNSYFGDSTQDADSDYSAKKGDESAPVGWLYTS